MFSWFISSGVVSLEKRITHLTNELNGVTEDLVYYERQLKDHEDRQHGQYTVEKNSEEPIEPKLQEGLPDTFIDSLRCPITLTVMDDPWMDYEGNTYEKNAILKVLEKEHISPITRNTLLPHSNHIFPNRALKNTIDKLRK